MGKLDWRRLFPIFLALLFCAYAAGSINAYQESRRKLRDSEITKLVEQNYRLAATLDDYLTEQRRHVAELADGSEVRNFLANRALGMSLRYGLQNSIDDIAARFRQVLAERRFGERRFITRLAFVDENGVVLADVGLAGPPPRLDESPDGLAVDAAAKTLHIAAKTERVNGKAGEIMAWADLGALLRFLLPSPAGPLDRTLALAPDGAEIGAFANFGPIPDYLRRVAIALTPGAHRIAIDPVVGGVVAVTAATGAQTGVTLAALRRMQTLESGSGEADFLFFAAATPLLALGAALFFERMQRRQSHLELVLKASRERLLAVTDNLVEGVVLVDLDDKILFVNRAAAQLMAAPLKDAAADPRSMVGRPLSDLLSLAAPTADPPPWRRAAADRRPCALNDAYLTSPNGVQINAALRCAPLMDPAAGPAAILSFRDIQTEKQAQRQIMQTARLVSIGELAAGVAHEINTPAQYIANNLTFLDDEMDKLLRLIRAGAGASGDVAADDVDYLLAEIPGAVAESRHGVEQIARIVRSVKEFAHPGGACHAPADLNHAAETALTVSHNIWKSLLEVELDLQPDLPPVICDIGEINQVFLNLIVNAAHAVESQSRPSPGRLRVRTRADGDMAEARFADDGPGVPAGLHERIFDPFFTTKPAGKGTGQGLAICRNIVAVKHGGSLNLDSVDGRGAAFVVRLPFTPPDDAADSGGANSETL